MSMSTLHMGSQEPSTAANHHGQGNWRRPYGKQFIQCSAVTVPASILRPPVATSAPPDVTITNQVETTFLDTANTHSVP
jgi:hypothetical protein